MRILRLLMVCAPILAVCGCGIPEGPFGDLRVPASDAPELKGRWCFNGDEQGFLGFIEIDDDGAPVTLEDNPAIGDDLGVDVVMLDGRVRVSDNGLQYAAVGSAVTSGDDVTIYLEFRVARYGYEFSATAIKMEGTRTEADRVDGVAVTIQNADGEDTLAIEAGAATRPGCD
ncbi:MAG: hypothetical protein C4547_09545 [Phycisphaerales bacterium]|nr:MAG: hypothetical protein C4547_09545 [Phycisphaerales bacterium]